MAKGAGGIRSTHTKQIISYRQFRSYGKEWQKTYFDVRTGGYVVTHQERIESSKLSKNELLKFNKEQTMAIDLARSGYKILHLSDKNRKMNRTYDVICNGVKTDLKSVRSHNNVKKNINHAIKKQGAKMVIIRLEKGANRAKALKEIRNAAEKNPGVTIRYYLEEYKIVRTI